MATDASLDTLRDMIGSSTASDGLVSQALDVAAKVIKDRVYATSWNDADVQHAVLMLGNRLYKRRQSAEGTTGVSPEGLAVRIMRTDPDINMLLELHLDMANMGPG